MTPKWINKNAEITGSHALYPQYLEILPSTGAMYQHALRVQLVPPNILKSTDSVTVKMTVALDTTIAKVDHDPYIGISDGTSFTGFVSYEKYNYPCSLVEGNGSTKVLKDIHKADGSTSVTSTRYPTETKIQFKTAEKWGSCYTGHDEGHINIGNFERLLDLSNGLYFEIYRDHAKEKYRIKYIEIDVDLD